MLAARLWMGAVLITALVLGTVFDERIGFPYPFWLLLSAVTLTGACFELMRLIGHRGLAPPKPLCYAGVLIMAASCWLPPLEGTVDRGGWSYIALAALTMVTMATEAFRFREPGRSVAAVCSTLFVLCYLGLLGGFLVQIRLLPHGLVALIFHLAIAKSGDIGAYFGGRATGRHKLCPVLSPGKTVEGALWGLAASVLAGWLAWRIASSLEATPANLGPGLACLLGLVVGCCAQIGDLVESLIKRDCEQKDSSQALPGFGGILDVLDSPIFSAPVTYLTWRWVTGA